MLIAGDEEGKWRRTDCKKKKIGSKGSIGVVCQRLPGIFIKMVETKNRSLSNI